MTRVEAARKRIKDIEYKLWETANTEAEKLKLIYSLGKAKHELANAESVIGLRKQLKEMRRRKIA